MKQIPLTQGKVAIVDDEDHEYLSQWKWTYWSTGYAGRYQSHGELERQPGERTRKRVVKMHRVIMNAPAEFEVDHINGDRLDNRRANLRLATPSQNQWNRRSSRGASSQYLGVSLCAGGKPWHAQIMVKGKVVNLGRFADEVEAARAYDAAASYHRGEFASLNFPASDGSHAGK